MCLTAVEGYRAVFTSFQPSVSIDKDLSILMQAFARDRPSDTPRLVSCNLDLVLLYLQSNVFEPAGNASLYHVTVKTPFILSLATAERVIEIQAISYDVLFNEKGAKT